MTRNRMLAALSLSSVLLVPILFDVEFNPHLALPRTVVKPDAAQEARYRRCVAEETDTATREALEAADNPDVQSLMIRMRQNEAVSRCRAKFPEQPVEVAEPLSLNLWDVRWRF